MDSRHGRRTRTPRAMRGVGIIAALILSGTGRAGVARQADAARLRALTPFPRALLRRMSLSVGQNYAPDTGAAFYWDAREPDAELDDARDALRGSVADAGRYNRIGELYAGVGDKQQALAGFARAVCLYERQVQHSPRDAALRTEYGRALSGAGRADEAQAQLGQAVRLAPARWQAWAALGRVWGDRARQRKPSSGASAASKTAVTASAALPLLNAQTQAMWKQAFACFDKAVALAPRQPSVYALRGCYIGRYAVAQHGASLHNQLAGLSDYMQAARLSRRDPYFISLAAWLAYSDYGIIHFKNESYDNFAVWKIMPDAERQRMRTMRGRVEALTHDPDAHIAARAYTGLAWLEYEFHDVPPARAQAHLRHALALDPRLRDAAQILMHTFAIEDEWPALAAFCADQAARRPSAVSDHSARLTLIHAFACERAGQTEKAFALAASASLKSEDAAALLTLAVLRLKYSDDPDNLKRAGEALDRCETLLTASGSTSVPAVSTPDTSLSDDRADYALLRGLCLALNGHVPEARQRIAQVVQADPDNAAARRIHDALPSH